MSNFQTQQKIWNLQAKISAVDFIKNNHAPLLKMYDKIVDAAKSIAENLKV